MSQNADIATDKIFLDAIKGLQEESRASLGLIQELAGLEDYIAETYAQRCLAELLQNSDDSFSTKVTIFQDDNFLTYANNGRQFSLADFKSLCKSASSSKVRGSSIGYRGIGFKSVVNICSTVYIISGNLKCCFDRNRTSNLLGCSSGVPLVRVPHCLTSEEELVCSRIVERNPGHSTYFIFSGLNRQSVIEEFSETQCENFLFLRHLIDISLDMPGISQLRFQIGRKEARVGKVSNCEASFVAISSNSLEASQNWIVISKDGACIAAKSSEGVPSRMLRQEALLHAYLPTQAVSCLGVRVSADFSTDPSRCRLKYDERTHLEISKVALLIVAIITELASSPDSLFLRALVDALIPYPDYKILELQGNKFCSCLVQQLESESSQKMIRSSTIRYLPAAYKGIEAIGSRLPLAFNVFLPVSSTYSDALRFFELIGSQPLPLEHIVNFHSLPENYIDAEACPIFLKNMLEADIPIKSLKSLYTLVTSEGSVVSAIEAVKNKSVLRESFFNGLADALLSKRRAYDLLDDLGISSDQYVTAEEQQLTSRSVGTQPLQSGIAAPAAVNKAGDNIPAVVVLDETAKRRYGIDNWRLSEEIVAFHYRSKGFQVVDVSQANKGYDLEVTADCRKFYVEVKDIRDSTKGFALTQNEYTEAGLLGESYVLALVQRDKDETLEIMFVANPGKSLQAYILKRAKAYEFLVSGFRYIPDARYV